MDQQINSAIAPAEAPVVAAAAPAEAPEKVMIVNKYGATACVLKSGLAKWLSQGGQGWKLKDESTTSNNGEN